MALQQVKEITYKIEISRYWGYLFKKQKWSNGDYEYTTYYPPTNGREPSEEHDVIKEIEARKQGCFTNTTNYRNGSCQRREYNDGTVSGIETFDPANKPNFYYRRDLKEKQQTVREWYPNGQMKFEEKSEVYFYEQRSYTHVVYRTEFYENKMESMTFRVDAKSGDAIRNYFYETGRPKSESVIQRNGQSLYIRFDPREGQRILEKRCVDEHDVQTKYKYHEDDGLIKSYRQLTMNRYGYKHRYNKHSTKVEHRDYDGTKQISTWCTQPRGEYYGPRCNGECRKSTLMSKN